MVKQHKNIQSEAVSLFCRSVVRCRMCQSSKLVKYLDLGFTPPADQFCTKDELNFPEIFYPLRVNLCLNCGLSQLSHVVDPRVLYQHDYLYESSITKTGQRHWKKFSLAVIERLGLSKGSLIVDIGSNDGTLLKFFKQAGMKVAGVDPAPNIVKIANQQNKIKTICDFFCRRTAERIKRSFGPASVITGTNVFAHIDDLTSLLKSVKYLLKKEGVFIFESPYFQNLIDKLQYDTIYHEHLSYLSLGPLVPFFNRFGMEIFAVEQTPIHGGSFRGYVDKKGLRPIDQSVVDLLEQERIKGLHEIEILKKFAERVYKNRKELDWLIERLLHQGKKIVAVSAPAKGMTLLNFCGLTKRQLQFVAEKSLLKVNHFTPGGHIPIVSDQEFLATQPDYALLLAWNFSEEIMKNLKAFSDKGGHFIIPVPKLKII